MRLALISDTHGMLPQIPADVDAVIHAGDIGVDRDPVNWFRDVLYPWAARVGKPIYATFGNHDRIGERHAVPAGKPANLHLLVDEAAEIGGVAFWFSPWSPRFFDWAFMADEDTLAKKYARIPDHTEAIVTHGPPFGAGDVTTMKLRTGSTALTERIAHLPRLRLVVTGHIHEARGEYQLGAVRVLNASYVNEFYKPVHRPMVIDLPMIGTGNQASEGTSGSLRSEAP